MKEPLRDDDGGRPAPGALPPLLPVLDAFNHRHRNQHRASHWWASFRILRRALGRLVDALGRGVRGRVAACARWVAAHVVPRAYVAFTQLAADNQHAPLGLLLVAVLSRVHAVVATLLPPEAVAATVERQSAPHPPQTPQSAADRGITVSRDQLPTSPNPAPVCSERRNASEDGDGEAKKRKRRKKRADELSDLFGGLA
ncbi:hypothetical protein CDD83_6849 [Cordyceps sp. RAO-2017]|nr:hypothetical protein CDD83_6849 [Cordyceps sp. RAO-2017]